MNSWRKKFQELTREMYADPAAPPRAELARLGRWLGRCGLLAALVACWCLWRAFMADDHDVAFGWCVWAIILLLVASGAFWASRATRPPGTDDLAELLEPTQPPDPIITRRRRPQTVDDIVGRAERGRAAHDDIAEALADPDKWERKRMELGDWVDEVLPSSALVYSSHDGHNWQLHAYIDLASEVVVDQFRVTEYRPGWRCCPMCGGIERPGDPCGLCGGSGALDVAGP